jgi:CheY-like chemotaxis protein
VHEHRHALLLVEDNEGIREALSELLQVERFDVRQAGDGQEALDALHAGFRPCLIILDLMMPGKSGWQFRQEQLLAPALKRIPVAVVSGHPNVRAAGEALGVQHFLAKPFDPAVLLAIVEQHCERRPRR